MVSRSHDRFVSGFRCRAGELRSPPVGILLRGRLQEQCAIRRLVSAPEGVPVHTLQKRLCGASRWPDGAPRRVGLWRDSMISDGPDEDSIGKRAVEATKWSLGTQIVAKLISPITTLVLAHILTPEAFGIVATITMVTSLADVLSDAGFQKYLIQHRYASRNDLLESANVAFWTNLAIALTCWLAIAVFRDPIARAVGNPGLGVVFAVAGVSLPLVALVSVQTALHQRAFDFRILFSSRVGSSLIILAVAVPLALVGWSYWSMVVGTIASNVFLACWLSFGSSWHPRLGYSFVLLRQMLSFSMWTLLETLLSWSTAWAGTFVLGAIMSPYYVGLYKTSISLTSAILGIASAAVMPIVFASLSRYQSDRSKFDDVFYRMQKSLALVLVPMALFLLAFRDPLVAVLLGPQWAETSLFVGAYGAASALVIVFGYLGSEVYRSLGRPKYSILVQLSYLVFLIPTLVISSAKGYAFLSVALPLLRAVVFTGIHFVVCRMYVKLSPWTMIANLRYIYVAAVGAAGAGAWALSAVDGNILGVALMVPSMVLYLVLVMFFRDTRVLVLDLLMRFGFGRAANRVEAVFDRRGKRRR